MTIEKAARSAARAPYGMGGWMDIRDVTERLADADTFHIVVCSGLGALPPVMRDFIGQAIGGSTS